jgi:hypothetical protein
MSEKLLKKKCFGRFVAAKMSICALIFSSLPQHFPNNFCSFHLDKSPANYARSLRKTQLQHLYTIHQTNKQTIVHYERTQQIARRG